MWFFLALFFAFWSSIAVSIAKRILKNTDVLVYIGFGNLVATISMGGMMLIRGIPRLDGVFWLSVLASSIIGVVVSLAYIKAIKIAPISLTAPMASATPLVATLFGFLLLGEGGSSFKLLGTLLIVAGVYFLHIADIKSSVFAPLQNLFQNRGVQLMLLAQALVGITPIFEKTAIFHTSPPDPLMVAFTGVGLSTIIFFPVMLVRSTKPFAQFKRNLWWFVLPAPMGVLATWAAFTAYSLTNVGYVTAIFKLSTLFIILWGALFFKEERISERLLGGGVMFLGTILLAT